VAEHIGSSVRTLQRRLREAGVTHTALVEHARRDMALRKLETTCLPISQVAKELGFGDPSSFSRAFQRWTGMSPRAYRRTLRQTALGARQKRLNNRST
jgi:AraC-like DNA-binding protein